MKMSMGDYRFVPGAPYPAELAGPVGKELEQLRRDLNRGITRTDVLTFAETHRESAIAQCFDWNVETAARAHWLATAGDLLRAIRVQLVIPDPKGKEEVTVIEGKQMTRVLPLDAGLHDGPVYLPAMEVLPNFHYRGQLIEGALQEKDRWVNKHSYLRELDVFFRKLEEADRMFGRTPPDGEAPSAPVPPSRPRRPKGPGARKRKR